MTRYRFGGCYQFEFDATSDDEAQKIANTIDFRVGIIGEDMPGCELVGSEIDLDEIPPPNPADPMMADPIRHVGFDSDLMDATHDELARKITPIRPRRP
jgi:hypothetical protein